MKKIKKILLLMCVLTCVFAITSCGKSEKDNKKLSFEYTDEELVSCLTTNTETVAEWDKASIKSAIDSYDMNNTTEAALAKGLQQFLDARDESGSFVGFYLNDNDEVKYKTIKDYDKDTITLVVKAKFEKRNVTIKYIFTNIDDQVGIESIIYEPEYSLAETMKKAGMNTIIGITTVVCVLVFLSILISLFVHVSKLEALIERIKNRNNNKEIKTESVNKTDVANNVADTEADYVDDLELVAVITAAIAASAQTSSDGFVVRSIKRVSRR